jgi:hypothetical protein
VKKIILMLAFILCMGGVAGAATLTDTTQFTAAGTIAPEDFVSRGWGDVNKLDGFLDYVVWKHQFTFDPAAASLDSATLTLSLRDDNDRYIGELGFGWTESGTWDFGEVDTGDYAYGIDVNYLYDGIFQVKLGSAFGDFYIDKSVLAINYTPVSNNAVPEPATMILFGLGLMGLAGVRRKLQK